ncbi:hypothetical protein C8R47DRAFT_1199042 [Mycena vitilis]|nr:hypothetical protein C8R47DRAFT_1199042 [Mycena vitilis]
MANGVKTQLTLHDIHDLHPFRLGQFSIKGWVEMVEISEVMNLKPNEGASHIEVWIPEKIGELQLRTLITRLQVELEERTSAIGWLLDVGLEEQQSKASEQASRTSATMLQDRGSLHGIKSRLQGRYLPLPTAFHAWPPSCAMPSADDDDDSFTDADDQSLIVFLFTYGILRDWRGSRLYESLGPQAAEDFAWSRHISAQGWRQRYLDHSSEFDSAVERHGKHERRAPRLPTAPPVVKTVGAASRRSTGNAAGSAKCPQRSVSSSSAGSTPSPKGPRKKLEAASSSQPPSSPSTEVRSHESPASQAPEQEVSPALTAHAVHRKLARTARKTLFSIDFVWAIYAQTGTVEGTREVLAGMQEAADTVLNSDEAAPGKKRKADTDPAAEKRAKASRRKVSSGNQE